WAGLWRAIKPPLLSGLGASAIGLIVKITLGGVLASIPFLLAGLGLVLGSYAWILLVAMGQKNLCVDLFTQVFRGARPGGRLIGGGNPVFLPRSARMPHSTLARMSQSRLLRKYLGRPYLHMNIWIWNHLPASSISWRPVRGYGCHLHRLVQLRATRRQS